MIGRVSPTALCHKFYVLLLDCRVFTLWTKEESRYLMIYFIYFCLILNWKLYLNFLDGYELKVHL